MPQRGAHGLNLGHFFSFKELFLIEQHVLFHADFLFVISDLRACDPAIKI